MESILFILIFLLQDFLNSKEGYLIEISHTEWCVLLSLSLSLSLFSVCVCLSVILSVCISVSLSHNVWLFVFVPIRYMKNLLWWLNKALIYESIRISQEPTTLLHLFIYACIFRSVGLILFKYFEYLVSVLGHSSSVRYVSKSLEAREWQNSSPDHLQLPISMQRTL